MKVSILINNFNYDKYLSESIESAINQTYQNCEIILYDDGSSDNSIEIANRYDDIIKIFSKTKYSKYPSFNQANAINEAMAISTGEIICLLDSDDYFCVNKVNKIVAAFKENPDAVLVQHLFEEIDNNSNPTGIIRPEIRDGKPCNIIYNECTLTKLFSQTSALSFRRSYLEKVLPIEEDEFEKIWSDVRLTRQSIFYGDVVTIKQPLARYRLHGKNDSLKIKEFSYYKDVITQMYGFFNKSAVNHDMHKLSLLNSIEWKEIVRIEESRHSSLKKSQHSSLQESIKSKFLKKLKIKNKHYLI